MKVDTKVSQEYTASIFRAKVRQVWKQSGYIGRLRGKWALRSREAERADFVGAMNMKLRAKYFDSGSSMFLGNDVIPR